MLSSVLIQINKDLYEHAKQDAMLAHRTVDGQIEYWAEVGRAAIDNPDLPISFIVESLASMREPRENALPFKPRSRNK
jgi:hypothetical protein